MWREPRRRRSAMRADRRKPWGDRSADGRHDPAPRAMRSRWAFRPARTTGLLTPAREELFVVGLRPDVDEAAHPVVAKAAQLRAGDLVVADAVWNEPHRDIETGHGILLHPHL